MAERLIPVAERLFSRSSPGCACGFTRCCGVVSRRRGRIGRRSPNQRRRGSLGDLRSAVCRRSLGDLRSAVSAGSGDPRRAIGVRRPAPSERGQETRAERESQAPAENAGLRWVAGSALVVGAHPMPPRHLHFWTVWDTMTSGPPRHLFGGGHSAESARCQSAAALTDGIVGSEEISTTAVMGSGAGEILIGGTDVAGASVLASRPRASRRHVSHSRELATHLPRLVSYSERSPPWRGACVSGNAEACPTSGAVAGEGESHEQLGESPDFRQSETRDFPVLRSF